jgi:hypothetical protein
MNEPMNDPNMLEDPALMGDPGIIEEPTPPPVTPPPVQEVSDEELRRYAEFLVSQNQAPQEPAFAPSVQVPQEIVDQGLEAEMEYRAQKIAEKQLAPVMEQLQSLMFQAQAGSVAEQYAGGDEAKKAEYEKLLKQFGPGMAQAMSDPGMKSLIEDAVTYRAKGTAVRQDAAPLPSGDREVGTPSQGYSAEMLKHKADYERSPLASLMSFQEFMNER